MSEDAILTCHEIILNSHFNNYRFVQAIKAVTQRYEPSPEILVLLEEFRKMLNDCIRIGIAENVTSMKALSLKMYHYLARYTVPSRYRLTAISKAAGILRNYRKALRKRRIVKRPHVKKLLLTDCYCHKMENGQLRLPIARKQYIYIPLNRHTLAVISGFTVRSVSLTACTLSIAFSKETAEIRPTGLIGLDRNLDNVATATDKGETRLYDLSEATKIKAIYREVKSHFHRNDVRIRKKIFSNYGGKQRNRVNQRLHKVSKSIVEHAKAEKSGIVMENLKGIRKLYRRGNGQGKEYRSRLNGWSFYELQRQIEYKAQWEGIKVFYVKPQKTSSTCSICGCEITECAERKVWCGRCQRLMDRDENAAYNIVQRGLRFKPVGLLGEAMVQECSQELILKVDNSQLISKGGKTHPTRS